MEDFKPRPDVRAPYGDWCVCCKFEMNYPDGRGGHSFTLCRDHAMMLNVSNGPIEIHDGQLGYKSSSSYLSMFKLIIDRHDHPMMFLCDIVELLAHSPVGLTQARRNELLEHLPMSIKNMLRSHPEGLDEDRTKELKKMLRDIEIAESMEVELPLIFDLQ